MIFFDFSLTEESAEQDLAELTDEENDGTYPSFRSYSFKWLEYFDRWGKGLGVGFKLTDKIPKEKLAALTDEKDDSILVPFNYLVMYRTFRRLYQTWNGVGGRGGLGVWKWECICKRTYESLSDNHVKLM